MNASALAELYNYNAYANGLVLDTAAPLSEEELHRDRGISRGSVFRILHHTMSTEAYFLSLCRNEGFSDILVREPFTTLAALREHWARVAREAAAYLAQEGLDLEKEVEPFLFSPELQQALPSLRLPKWQLLFQAAGHSSQHRGEVSVLLTELGHPVPDLDPIVLFIRARGFPWPP